MNVAVTNSKSVASGVVLVNEKFFVSVCVKLIVALLFASAPSPVPKTGFPGRLVKFACTYAVPVTAGRKSRPFVSITTVWAAAPMFALSATNTIFASDPVKNPTGIFSPERSSV